MTQENNVPLTEFYDMIDRFDWSYMMSDDHRVWEQGSAQESKLLSIAKQSPEHQALWDGFKKHWWSGPYMGTERAPKPERPS
jgi:hypothetical protein